ncbi:hypothetical protein MLD38_002454 [Melastoma candidum]|uniref:Uncharacterized protein n=1 Tax=Melastoma candidum TaxID=119954 RepID=A0ACB9S7Y5_9MYRT|nr:hypothetical protein MLD38_002454 [Melastoma candidum]
MGMVMIGAMEVLPYVVMFLMEGCTIGLTILAKTAMSDGMNLFVFVAYTNVLAYLILLPYSFFYHRNGSTQAQIGLGLFLRLFFMGLTGITIAQYLNFIGLYNSSPIMVCAMGLLTPMFSFLIALVLRTTKPEWRSTSVQAKIIGTVISILGGISTLIYLGPAVKGLHVPSFIQVPPQSVNFALSEDWIIGGLLLAGSAISIIVFNIIQLSTLELYPQVLKLMSFSGLIGTALCVAISLSVERDLSVWVLKLDFELALIIATAIFSGMIRNRVHLWCTHTKGPLFVPLFRPLGIFWATLFGSSFFPTTIHYGSIAGSLVIGVGYYAMMWGQIKESETQRGHEGRNGDASDNKVPLLHDETQEA